MTGAQATTSRDVSTSLSDQVHGGGYESQGVAKTLARDALQEAVKQVVVHLWEKHEEVPYIAAYCKQIVGDLGALHKEDTPLTTEDDQRGNIYPIGTMQVRLVQSQFTSTPRAIVPPQEPDVSEGYWYLNGFLDLKPYSEPSADALVR